MSNIWEAIDNGAAFEIEERHLENGEIIIDGWVDGNMIWKCAGTDLFSAFDVNDKRHELTGTNRLRLKNTQNTGDKMIQEPVEFNPALGFFITNDRDEKLDEYALRYHMEVELYDNSVCSNKVIWGGIMPTNDRERSLINRNAINVRNCIISEAEKDGFSADEVQRAIANYGLF